MIILTLRTDKTEAEVGIYEDTQQLSYHVWEAHRQLAETIHQVILDQLHAVGREMQDIKGIVVYKGPGSFTGLRIGVTVANAMADGLGVPVVGATDIWIEQGIERLLQNENEKVVIPEYGAAPHITAPRK